MEKHDVQNNLQNDSLSTSMELSKLFIRDISEILQYAISQKVFPGCVLGVVSDAGEVVIPIGRQTYRESSISLEKDSIFDVASITKTIPTSLLALHFLEKGLLHMDNHVSNSIPEFTGHWKDEVTIRHLLTQTVDFGLTLSSLKHTSGDNILRSILTCDLQNKPGTSYAYTNSTSIVLGIVLERISGRLLSELAEDVFFKPLGMKDSSFNSSIFNQDRIVPTEHDVWRKRDVKGEIHDESAYLLSKKQYVGSAGLFSTVPDLLRVLKMVNDYGMFEGKRIYSEESISQMLTNQLSHIQSYSSIGWEMNQSFVPKEYEKDSIGKTGFTGCFMFYNPLKRIGVVHLSNYHYPKRKLDFTALNEVRYKLIKKALSL